MREMKITASLYKLRLHHRPEGSAHALPDGSALGGLLDYQAGAGDGADGGGGSSASDTLTGPRSGGSEVPSFD